MKHILSGKCSKLLALVRGLSAPWAFELLVIMSLLLLVEMALPGSTSITSMSPHPLWIPVLLLSAQYGVGAGLAAATSAIVINWLIGWPLRASGEDFYDYSLRIWREPILWLGASVILGGFRTQELYKLKALREQLGHADVQRQAIAVVFEKLKAHCEALERRILCARDRTIEAGLAALGAVRDSSVENIEGPLARAVNLLFETTAYSVLVWRDTCFVPMNAGGGAAGLTAKTITARKLPLELEELLLREARVVSIRSEGDAGILNGVALIASPILSTNTKRVVGALLIHAMDASRLDENIERSVQALCEALAAPLDESGADQAAASFEHSKSSVATQRSAWTMRATCPRPVHRLT